MFGIRFQLVCFADPSLGRLNYESMSQQALMEMVVSQMNKYYDFGFKDKKGNFLDLTEWQLIKLSADGKSVEEIDWEYDADDKWFKKPEGMGAIHIEWLPETVREFTIDHNGWEGTIDCTKLPTRIENFSAANNRLKGSLDLGALPDDIVTFDVRDNFLTGSIDLSVLPQRLESLLLSKNRLSGSLSISDQAPSLVGLFLHKNRFSGDLDLTTLPKKLASLWLNDNSFEGTLTVGRPIFRLKATKNNQWKNIRYTVDSDKGKNWVE